MSDIPNQKRRRAKERPGPYRWAVQVFFLAIALSAALSLVSETSLNGAGAAAAALVLAVLSLASEVSLGGAGAAAAGLVLAVFIGLGILFDIIGVAVTAADPRPFHSMAAHKEPGAKEALMLLRNAGRVSSVCNDVVGDICGIVSGTTTAVIVVRLQTALALPESVLLSVAVTALVSGLTIGGKALGKTVALNKSTSVVYWVGRFLHLFHR